MNTRAKKGQIVVISGPSGVGKSTVISEVRNQRQSLTFSISYTTRKPRSGEENHVHYHFVDMEVFSRMIEAGEFLEYACYQGQYYGTSRADVEALVQSGHDVLLDIEVQGGAQVRHLCPEATLIFVIPPSFGELSRRLHGRQSESEEVIQGRLQRAREEYQEIPLYDFLVVNDKVPQAADEVLSILKAQDCRVSARLDMIKEDIVL
ncbi:MAG: guanylate kinase [Clostridiales bacterium]|nr:guanylate kinase [Clostridiales bacterium]MCD7753739.1 guanylate kinase [Clostridiales bacterium]MCD7801840.1 guanylate kinase [Clostridiales bacterium]MCD7880353.1 guanylate kinase [Clostridiales bacterium]